MIRFLFVLQAGISLVLLPKTINPLFAAGLTILYLIFSAMLLSESKGRKIINT